jgi:SAM-dependent methyltransferase
MKTGVVRYTYRKARDIYTEFKNNRQFRREFDQFTQMAGTNPRFPTRWEETAPMMNERTGTLPFDASYVYHTAWAVRCLANSLPAKHVDISSYIFFNAMLSAFIPVEFYDYRPAPLKLSNLVAGSQDLTKLTFADNSIASLSCMHVVEHIGLGRYGDPFDPDGDVKATRELKRVLAPGGLLLFVVPSGESRIVFNAHRVYNKTQVLNLFDGLTLESFALLPDKYEDGLIEGASAEIVEKQRYGCGCYAFRKPAG